MAVSYHCAAAAAANAPGGGLRAAGEESNQDAPQQIMQPMRLSDAIEGFHPTNRTYVVAGA